MKAKDGIEIFVTRNSIDHPRAVMVIVHGICEHSGRYNYTASRFNEWGYSVYRFDLRGHGRSGGRGDL